jgi:hypothetical protein
MWKGAGRNVGPYFTKRSSKLRARYRLRRYGIEMPEKRFSQLFRKSIQRVDLES